MKYYLVCYLVHKQVRETECGRTNDALMFAALKRKNRTWLEENRFVLTCHCFFFLNRKTKLEKTVTLEILSFIKQMKHIWKREWQNICME